MQMEKDETLDKNDMGYEMQIDVFKDLRDNMEMDLKKLLDDCCLYIANWCGFQNSHILEHIKLEITTNKDSCTKSYTIGIEGETNTYYTKILVEQDFEYMLSNTQREHITKLIIFGFIDIYILKNSNIGFIKLLAEHKLVDYQIKENDIDIDQHLMNSLVKSLLVDVYKRHDDNYFKKSFFFYDILSQTIPTKPHIKS